ncbi:hypothetical protein GPECTOR_11g312 [Gonium pectorale]|uniref:Plastid lipid-associated protein/fibrillin conserved domain-containing protein n=1 Tax=Gonium pectorale TaxID=33097 RepID=A0A150GPW1_GONPE|nr:hypothetical protein GPECTOR_11g312 [Gonium pectorale]|eukprot:KXZ51877.1 hypothetical protein GPECTOR_11g312 [Gonium pectorale]
MQTGETLAQIALAYGVAVEQIKAPPQLLAGVLGAGLLAAGTARALIKSGDEPQPAAAVEAAGSAAAAQGEGPTPLPAAAAAAAPHVASAVAEVRALLRDAAVEVNAVEAALAAVRRATAAPAHAAPAAPALPQMHPPAEAHANGNGHGNGAAAAAKVVVTAAAMPAAAIAVALEPAAADAPAHVITAPAGAVAAAPAAPAVAEAALPAAAEAEPEPATVPAVASDAASTAPESTAVGTAGDGAGGEAQTSSQSSSSSPSSITLPDLEAFDTAIMVAAARTRVQAALDAAQSMFGISPAPAAASVDAVLLVTAAEITPPSDSDDADEVVVAVEAEAAGRPMDAAAAGQVLERIRVINKLLEQEQQRAETAGLRPSATAIDLSAEATGAVDAKAAESAAVAPPLPPPQVDRDRAAGLLVRVDRLLSSFDDLDLEAEERLLPASPSGALAPAALLPPGPAAAGPPAAPPSPSAADSSTTAKLRLYLPRQPPPPALLGPGTPPPAAAAASPAADAGLIPASGPATLAPVSVTEALEEAVRPLAAAIPGPVLDRFRDIGRLLEQQPAPIGAIAATAAAAAAAPPPHAARADATLVNLKSGLLDLVYGTARGVNATALQRAAIEEFVCALEARNPNACPTDAVSALVGRWKLVYTSNLASLMLLGALDAMPLVEMGDVVQTINPDSLTATNKIDLSVPLLVSLRAEAGLEVRSPRQFKVRLSRLGLDTYVATPQLTAALEVPDSVQLMGASLDLAPLRRLLAPINSGIEAAQGLLNRATSPELDLDSLPLPPGVSPGAVSDAASVWMLTTYLDDNLRISRDDDGRVFIMLKDVGIYPNDIPQRASSPH